jgi:hypothetical protein
MFIDVFGNRILDYHIFENVQSFYKMIIFLNKIIKNNCPYIIDNN